MLGTTGGHFDWKKLAKMLRIGAKRSLDTIYYSASIRNIKRTYFSAGKNTKAGIFSGVISIGSEFLNTSIFANVMLR